MKSKRKKPTVKELSEDLQTVYKVVASHSYTIDTLRILLENYLEMKKDTKKLAKFMEAKTEKMKDETQRDAVLEKDEATTQLFYLRGRLEPVLDSSPLVFKTRP